MNKTKNTTSSNKKTGIKTAKKKPDASKATAKQAGKKAGPKVSPTSSKKQEFTTRSGLDRDSLREDIKLHLRHTLAKDEFSRTPWDEYRSVVLCYSLRGGVKDLGEQFVTQSAQATC